MLMWSVSQTFSGSVCTQSSKSAKLSPALAAIICAVVIAKAGVGALALALVAAALAAVVGGATAGRGDVVSIARSAIGLSVIAMACPAAALLQWMILGTTAQPVLWAGLILGAASQAALLVSLNGA
ncbi:MAG: hypothetical protein ACOYKZ_05080 [Chlamydiia bacterium]